ncbi:SEC-C domain-containing protein, partial [Candidatus Gottesmanbacteria bacterium]|nr:SEC-C domain-containing protein [Candidatus Gottesmanbacteria bacterium]
VLNKQREIVYKLRRQIVVGEDLKNMILEKLESQIHNIVNLYQASGFSSIDREKILQEFVSIIPFDPNSQKGLLLQFEQMKDADTISDFLVKVTRDTYEQKEKSVSQEIMRQIEKWASLSVVDNFWMDHLDAVDDLREGIGLRGYGQLDPLVEYKNEAFSMFERLIAAVDYEIAHRIFKIQVQLSPDQIAAIQKQQQTTISKEAQHQQSKMGSDLKGFQGLTPSGSNKKKLGRNDPCWCGSGKKWKRCHYPQTK